MRRRTAKEIDIKFFFFPSPSLGTRAVFFLFPSSSLGTQLCRSSSFDSYEAVPKPELGNEGKGRSLRTRGILFPLPLWEGIKGRGERGIFPPAASRLGHGTGPKIAGETRQRTLNTSEKTADRRP
jgi:hypothetical protein